MSVSDVETEQAQRAAAWGAEKRSYVRRTFSEIAPRYDLLNHLLSFNVDRRWRRRAIDALSWRGRSEGTYLDLCAGTLDVTAQLCGTAGFRGFVIGADFAEPMLRAGAKKVDASSASAVAADALQLPVGDDSAAGILIAFGVRNFANLSAGLAEAFRVLAPGGRLVILEFSTPRARVMRTLYHLYFHHVLPFIGGVVSGHRTAYRYLPASVSNFPVEAELARQMERAGFANVRWESLTFGIAAIHVGEKIGARG
jgi:demethylmenaquinone methyltransferase/2-methoxy-6-polyprenyl-1,4-benzoquinol methylase